MLMNSRGSVRGRLVANTGEIKWVSEQTERKGKDRAMWLRTQQNDDEDDNQGEKMQRRFSVAAFQMADG